MTERRPAPGQAGVPARDMPAVGDKLVPFPDAARRLGRSVGTLRLWADAGHLPAVTTPGGQWSAYESFIEAVLASARPGRPGRIEEIARDWFAGRAAGTEVLA